MSIVPFGEWLPDQAPLNNPGSTLISGCYPNAQTGYGPIKALGSPLAPSALNGKVIGALGCVNDLGEQFQFAATASKIYQIYGVGNDWADVTGAATGVISGNAPVRKFAQYNNLMLCADDINPLMSYEMTGGVPPSSSFQPLAAPGGVSLTAKYIATVKGFCMVANVTTLADGVVSPFRVWWSSSGDPTTWPTPGSAQAQADQSDYTDLLGTQGDIMGLVSNLGNAEGAVIFRNGIWRILYQGPPVVFGFYPAAGEIGTIFPNSIVQLDGVVYYIGNDGIRAFDGIESSRLGDGKVDNWFWNTVTQESVWWVNVVGDVDPTTKTIRWIFPSTASGTGIADTQLIYSYAFNRFSMTPISAEFLFRSSLGIQEEVAFFTPDHLMRQEQGTPIQAQLATTEAQPSPGRRTYFRSIRPLIDGGAPTAHIESRSELESAYNVGAEGVMNVSGYVPVRADDRYARAVVTVPAGDTWAHAEGIEFDGTPSGLR